MSLLHNSLFIALASGVGFIVAYYTYGRFIARKILGFDPSKPTPALQRPDGVDYVSTHPAVLYGHHFSSIAGLGPIVGPAIAVVWGWGPALLWILFGSIFMGAVHDLATLYASLRHEGRGIGDLTNEVIGPRARILFLIIIFFLLALAMGVFALYMAKLFTDMCPQAVVPTFSLIAIAVIIGLLVYKLRWGLGKTTLIGLVLMFAMLVVGLRLPVPLWRAFVSDSSVRQSITVQRGETHAGLDHETSLLADPAATHFQSQAETDPSVAGYAATIRAAGQRGRATWTYVLLGYAFIASVLPVWLLLQPRDYINSYQLYLGLLAMLVGLVVWHPSVKASAFASAGTSTDPVLPFLFITVACGAISGFHNLVSSGTTVRQLRSEAHAQPIGYGAMLTEGFLAVLVILADRFNTFYHASQINGLAAFLSGAGTVVSKPVLGLGTALGVSPATVELFCKSFMAVVVISFAMTTLDSATRLLRFNVEEIGKVVGVPLLRNRYVASMVAVIAIGFFALIKIGGKPAGVTLWQLFGTTNQLLAAIGLLVVSVMLYKMGKPIIYTMLPMVLMVISVAWAMTYKLIEFYRTGVVGGDSGAFALFVVGAVLLVLAIWLVIEAAMTFIRFQNGKVPAVEQSTA
jgi:carbon starvation protein